MRTSLALVVMAAIGCGGDAPVGPPVPDKAAREATADAIDEAKGFEKFTIGQPKSKLVNVGRPDSYEYFDGGVKLSVYRKARVKVKVGDVAFTKVSLYFGKTEEMQMYRLYAPTDRAECESAKTKFTDLYGPGNPKGYDKYLWTGREVQATWEHTTVRGTPTCYIEVRAIHFR